MCSFEIYGKWSVQASIDTHTHAQYSHASVGLAQAHPNDVPLALFFRIFVET